MSHSITECADPECPECVGPACSVEFCVEQRPHHHREDADWGEHLVFTDEQYPLDQSPPWINRHRYGGPGDEPPRNAAPEAER